MVSNNQFAGRARSPAQRKAAYRTSSKARNHLLNNLQTVVMELDGELRITFLNAAWQKFTGYPIEESIDRPFKAYLTGINRDQYPSIESILRTVLNGERESCELELGINDSRGRQRWVHLKVSRSLSVGKSPTIAICLDDATKRKDAREQLEYLATHDALTHLYNRHYFKISLERLSTDALRNGGSHGLVYIDLDFFKLINDSFGHDRGDEILREIARLIRQRVREADIPCRLGGDEFAILLRDRQDAQVVAIARDIQSTIIDYSFKVGANRVDVGCSVGISVIDGSCNHTGEDYLMRADTALYVAKQRGRNLVHVYDPSDKEGETLRNNIDWGCQIRQAISENRLVLYLQPVVDITTRAIAYHEVLVRMVNVDGRLVMPEQFIVALEDTGDMALLDRWVVKNTIALAKKHPQLGGLSINLSAQTLQSETLVPMIRENLRASNVDPSRINLELTESASLLNIKTTQRVITELHALGCSFSVDDFGSGFSTFSYLKDLPADAIKLDGSFIRNLHNDKVDQALVRSIVEVIQALGRKIVAEFVENEEILQFLVDNGVDYAQGFHLGKPIPAQKIVDSGALLPL